MLGTKRVNATSEGGGSQPVTARGQQSQGQTGILLNLVSSGWESSLEAGWGIRDRQEEAAGAQREGQPQQTSNLSPNQEKRDQGTRTWHPVVNEPREVLCPALPPPQLSSLRILAERMIEMMELPLQLPCPGVL